MHALHMPPRLAARAALLALLLALAMMLALTELSGVELPTFGGGGGEATSAPFEPSSERPAWLSDPLRDPISDLRR